MSVSAASAQGTVLQRSGLAAHPHHSPELTPAPEVERTSQTIFGERQYLLRVLDSVERSHMSSSQQARECQALERMIYARTQELNQLNPDWDEKVAAVLRPGVGTEELDRLAQDAPADDHFLLRIISEHPSTSGETLERLSRHSDSAIRENVARHPNALPETLEKLCHDRFQPLWYLVAHNPAAPAALRRQLTRQMKQVGRKSRAK